MGRGESAVWRSRDLSSGWPRDLRPVGGGEGWRGRREGDEWVGQSEEGEGRVKRIGTNRWSSGGGRSGRLGRCGTG